MRRFFLILAMILTATAAFSQSSAPDGDTVLPNPAEPELEPPMTFERLSEIVRVLDEDAIFQGSAIQLTIADIPVIVITDSRADRMRAMVPIRAADGLEPEELMRLMQANFDSALDARYTVAQGRLWGVFIHPL